MNLLFRSIVRGFSMKYTPSKVPNNASEIEYLHSFVDYERTKVRSYYTLPSYLHEGTCK